MNKNFKTKIFLFLTLLFIFVFPLLIVSAAPNLVYDPMETIPGFTKTANFTVFISNLYKFGIWTIGICALIMIVIGGYMYAASGGNNASMEKAKGFIKDAIAGLILALLAYLILYIINPELIKIKMGSASTTTTTTTTPTPTTTTPTPTTTTPTTVTPPATTGLTPATASTCQTTSSQVPSQCKDASSNLNNLIGCVNTELAKINKKVQVSSISDGNGGVNCYTNNPTWSQCTTSNQTYCCFHKSGSCHYGGTSGGASCAVDYSTKGSSATNAEIKQAATSSNCKGSAIDEGNHVHVSVPSSSCNCSG